MKLKIMRGVVIALGIGVAVGLVPAEAYAGNEGIWGRKP